MDQNTQDPTRTLHDAVGGTDSPVDAGNATQISSDRTQFAFSPLNAEAKPDPTELQTAGDQMPPAVEAKPDLATLLGGLRSMPISSPNSVPGVTAATPPKPETNSLTPRILKGRFVVEDILGAGGMGVVYKAKDLLKVEAQDREPYVAIKVLGEDFKAHPEAFISLQRESRKTQKIAHPNIVNVHDFDRDGETVFMTMEYLEGRPLDKVISQYRASGLPFDAAQKILADICAALIYAHGQNIIHSDFKPGNIFVCKNRTVKVLDFGIARAAAIKDQRGNSQDDRTIFDAGSLGALTPTYASLEMLAGAPPDARDDIYALGCIAYELICGTHPFGRKHADQAAKEKLKPKRLPQLNANQWRAIEGALAFKREERIASVAEFWAQFSYQKKNRRSLYAAVLVAVLAAPAAYYFWPKAPVGPSESQVRSEIEKRLRIELSTTAFNKLIADANFSPAWQEQLYNEFSQLRDLVGASAPVITQGQTTIIGLYQNAIEQALNSKNIDSAKTLLENARRFSADASVFASNQARLDELIALQEAERKKLLDQVKNEPAPAAVPVVATPVKPVAPPVKPQEQIEKENYKTALANVDEQLACKNGIDIRDLDIAVTKLRSISSLLYAKDEPRILNDLVACIQKIAEVSAPRADDIRKLALRVFNNDPRLNALRFVQKDSCSSSLAGLGRNGARAQCRDTLSNGGRAPVLVVVPAAGEFKAFAIGKYEVAYEDINNFCQTTGQCKANSETAKPATDISLASAQAYLQWLSKNSGKRYRLPSAAEWLYAAKSGAESLDPNRNCKLNSRGIQKGDALINATQGQQNAWGLVNVLGNAREWVGNGGQVMGGSFETPMENCTFNQGQSHDGKADAVTGFRVLRELTDG